MLRIGLRKIFKIKEYSKNIIDKIYLKKIKNVNLNFQKSLKINI